MPFLNYEYFTKFAHPTIVEIVGNEDLFDEYNAVVSSQITFYTNIPATTPFTTINTSYPWLVPIATALISKLAFTKLQNASEDLTKLVNDNYADAMNTLKSYNWNNYSTLLEIQNMWR